MPKITVIVPVYNASPYVERAIVSLMEQTLDDVEFIIIDDGSQDGSADIIREIVNTYPARINQVNLIVRENRGVAATRAQGMDLATGDYVIHFDSDDWAEPRWLEAMYNKAIETNADVVVCDYFEVHRKQTFHVKQQAPLGGIECVSHLLLGELIGVTWNKLVNRNLCVKSKLQFDASINFLEDFIFVMEVFLNASMIAYLDEPCISYNKTNESSITSSVDLNKVNTILNATKKIESILLKYGLNDFLLMQLSFFKLHQKIWVLVHMQGDIPAFLWGLYPETRGLIWRGNQRLHNKIILFLAAFGPVCFARNTLSLFNILRRIKTGLAFVF